MSHFGPPVAAATSNDPLSRMRAYQIAKDLLQAAWLDAKTLSADAVTQKMSGQLYAAVGSVSANIAEGYSRSSGIDRSRIFEYALGSVRESMTWYEAARPILGDTVLTRLNDLEEIRRLLLAIIPRERARRGRLTKQ
jgi:four helix bundle protein